MPWEFDNRNREEPLIDIFRQHLFTHHISPYHKTQSHGVHHNAWYHKTLFTSLWREEENKKIIIDNPYDMQFTI